MTTEEKAALVGLCRIEIKRWKVASESNPNMRYMVNLMEIALGALTLDLVAVPKAWCLVPVEPTQKMVDAHMNGVVSGGFQCGYRAMLAAAPTP